MHRLFPILRAGAIALVLGAPGMALAGAGMTATQNPGLNPTKVRGLSQSYILLGGDRPGRRPPPVEDLFDTDPTGPFARGFFGRDAHRRADPIALAFLPPMRGGSTTGSGAGDGGADDGAGKKHSGRDKTGGGSYRFDEPEFHPPREEPTDRETLDSPAPVPLPPAGLLFPVALAGLGLARRRRTTRQG